MCVHQLQSQLLHHNVLILGTPECQGTFGHTLWCNSRSRGNGNRGNFELIMIDKIMALIMLNCSLKEYSIQFWTRRKLFEIL